MKFNRHACSASMLYVMFAASLTATALFGQEAGDPSADAALRSSAETQQTKASNLADLDVTQLMNVVVTSASKKEESLAAAPAAIYVITSDDIRRSGFSSLPELFRMVPGLTVQQVNSHSWTVSARGFNGFPNEKLLVLIDGRAVYDPLYGGVYWDVQDLRLEDIARIEVIRGPGGALWGANAVNGVINIVTKSARDTQGLSLATSLGHAEGYEGSVRYGGHFGERMSYRVFAKSSFWDPFVQSSGAELFNDWNLSEAGFRSDWDINDTNSLSLDAAGYKGSIHDSMMSVTLAGNSVDYDQYQVKGGHLLGQWKHTFSEHSSMELVGYCDWTNRTDAQFGGEYRDTCDAELQHNYQLRPRHSVIWGGGVRTSGDQTRVMFRNHFNPTGRRMNLVTSFGQYEVQVIPERLKVTAGSKFEHDTFTGFHVQPQIRAVWSPAKGHDVWVAVPRSVRTPTRNENGNFLTGYLVPLGPPPALSMLVTYIGNPDLKAERQKAYELGYRYQYKTIVSADVALFYNSYSDLIYPDLYNPITSIVQDPPYSPYVLGAIVFTNYNKAQTHGLEMSVKYRPVRPWLVSLGVTEDRGTGISMYATPRHQFYFQSRLDLPRRLSVDSALYHTNAIAILSITNLNAPTINRVDTGVTWRPLQDLSLGFWGRNLQGDHHPEGSGGFTSTGEVRRSFVAKMEWNFEFERNK